MLPLPPRPSRYLTMDPDSPLNRAHQCERKAERLLNNGLYDAALQCYKDASEYVQDAMKNTHDVVALHSLCLQKDNYEKMPSLVKKRKQHGQLKINLESLHLDSSIQQDIPDYNGQMYKENEEDAADGVGTGGDINLRSVEPVMYGDRSVGSVREDRAESFESLPSTASEETDSLLLCLHENSEMDSRVKRIVYSPAKVLRALRALEYRSLAVRQPQVESIGPRKMQKGDGVLLEELETKNSHLREHVVSLLEQLEGCESENSRLRDSVEELKQELETQKSKLVVQRVGSDIGRELSLPFTLAAPMMNGMSASSDSRIMIPQTPPALSPLEMPNFEDQ